jgi:hypothetical protein
MEVEFKNIKAFNKFCDKSMICVCGNLMTGLHMSGCRRLNKIRAKLIISGKKVSKHA